VLYVGFLATMFLVGRQANLGFNFLIALLVAAGFIVWQFVSARDRSRERCFAAFLNNQWVGLCVFAGIALDMAMRGP
jgi:4-hydroxybenzoate polyprenyltransferase